MDSIKKTFIVCTVINVIVTLIIFFNNYRYDSYGAAIGMGSLALAVIYFFVGLLLCIAKETRKIGKAILLYAGISFVIGLSVCSASSTA